MQYVYELIESGEIIEKTQTVAEMEACRGVDTGLWQLPEGLARRRHDIEQGGWRNSHQGWPMLDDAAGVHPSQIQENVEYMRKAGVPTDFHPDGRIVWRDRAHRKAGLKALGFHDRNGGYGD